MIRDYKEVNECLDRLSKGVITEVEPIGYTELENLPIRHFTLGSGSNHVVVSGSMHANEIITTSFVLELMEYLSNNVVMFSDITVHFVPIYNPEGYIVCTSAIRSLIPSGATYNELIKVSKEYYIKYRADSIVRKPKIKAHQEMFKDTGATLIDGKYKSLISSVDGILRASPKGSMINWASNGRGIDLNSNSYYKMVNPGDTHKAFAYNNIRVDRSSPIGYPGDTNAEDFMLERENLAMKGLLDRLSSSGTLLAYFNYHSTGGIIYQRPEHDLYFSTPYNYLLSKVYSRYTDNNGEPYSIVMDRSNRIVSFNDFLRVTYPGNLLVELSPMGGNPIGPFGDLNNYNRTILSNIKSFIFTLFYIKDIYKYVRGRIYNGTVIEAFNELDDIYELKKRKE